MKKIVSRYSLSCVLGLVAFVPLAGMLSPASSSSQPISSAAPELSLMPLSQSLNQKQVPLRPSSSAQRYTSPNYQITLGYPKNWQPTQGYEERFSGSDGFFQVTAAQSSTLQDACNSTAQHRLKPYGNRPQVQRLQIKGRPACLILPSADQDRAMERMATLIVRYSRPIRVKTGTYNHFVLNANKEHIRQIANTLRFTMPR